MSVSNFRSVGRRPINLNQLRFFHTLTLLLQAPSLFGQLYLRSEWSAVAKHSRGRWREVGFDHRLATWHLLRCLRSTWTSGVGLSRLFLHPESVLLQVTCMEMPLRYPRASVGHVRCLPSCSYIAESGETLPSCLSPLPRHTPQSFPLWVLASS